MEDILIPWDTKSGTFKEGNGNSFIISLREDSNFVKLKCLNKTYEVYHSSSYLCSFGDIYGFKVYNNNDSTN